MTSSNGNILRVTGPLCGKLMYWYFPTKCFAFILQPHFGFKMKLPCRGHDHALPFAYDLFRVTYLIWNQVCTCVCIFRSLQQFLTICSNQLGAFVQSILVYQLQIQTWILAMFFFKNTWVIQWWFLTPYTFHWKQPGNADSVYFFVVRQAALSSSP